MFSTDDEGPGASGAASRGPTAPLAVRMRPRTLDEVVGQQHVLGPGSPLRRLVEGGDGRVGPASVILWGPPGTGKTTLAHVVSGSTGSRFVELSAVTAGVKDVRRVMDEAHDERALHQRHTVLFLDEIHRFTKAQQDALLPGVENRWVVLIAATTENPSFSVVAPLLSRSLLVTLQPLDDEAIRTLVLRAVSEPRGLGGEVRLTDDALDHLVRLAGGDARRALTVLEAAAGAAVSEAASDVDDDQRPTVDGADVGDAREAGGDVPGEPVLVTVEHAERALDVAVVRYDREGDQHYDVISAFIKSMRGSDVDASLHYLARMLEAGEDPRFIARRIVIAASEDVGMADPSALQTAVAAAQAVQLIGMPEARIILAQAVVHLATAPKSNASYLGVGAAIADVRAGLSGLVPPHLRDSHYPGAKKLGHGKGYRYAHDEPHGVAAQQYLPDSLQGRTYYEPTDRGAEREIRTRLERLRRILRGD
ncbi:MAG TPA: replication-associated recombination protein A [Actinomycetales bacterium]|nr:replication-associated recombination protein A [Actinomycetales bacterium]